MADSKRGARCTLQALLNAALTCYKVDFRDRFNSIRICGNVCRGVTTRDYQDQCQVTVREAVVVFSQTRCADTGCIDLKAQWSVQQRPQVTLPAA
ncbi:hypothetical protein EVAR_72009_1 [Eumeta japonica]|uniref:Uncharacterized protein n=1 Tax=Eumeta variegata TaxID=151549 RepID=A0A4C1SZH2_EUMVA|nr:hypothetical protein EVAR_72009_1 [Eumeta japonica]